MHSIIQFKKIIFLTVLLLTCYACNNMHEIIGNSLESISDLMITKKVSWPLKWGKIELINKNVNIIERSKSTVYFNKKNFDIAVNKAVVYPKLSNVNEINIENKECFGIDISLDKKKIGEHDYIYVAKARLSWNLEQIEKWLYFNEIEKGDSASYTIAVSYDEQDAELIKKKVYPLFDRNKELPQIITIHFQKISTNTVTTIADSFEMKYTLTEIPDINTLKKEFFSKANIKNKETTITTDNTEQVDQNKESKEVPVHKERVNQNKKSKMPPVHKKQVNQNKKSKMPPVHKEQVNQNKKIKEFNEFKHKRQDSMKLYVCDDRFSCGSNELKRCKYIDYWNDEIINHYGRPGIFAKLMYNDNLEILCVPTTTFNKKKLTLNFKPSKQRLLIISQAKELKPYSLLIKKCLFDKINKIKNKHLPFHFHIFYIEPGQYFKEIINDKNLKTLTKPQIHALIYEPEFTANDLHALQNLSLFDIVLIPLKHLDQVMYINGNSHFFEMDNIPAVHMAVPMKWYLNNKSLNVLTLDHCDVWKNKIYANDCKTISPRSLEKMLNVFFFPIKFD